MPPRRSERNRTPAKQYEAGPSNTWNKRTRDDPAAGSSNGKPAKNPVTYKRSAKNDDEFEQLDLLDAKCLPHPGYSDISVVMHPVALSVVAMHSHFAETEICGFLGGVTYFNNDGSQAIFVAEAFPARNKSVDALAQRGGSAFNEVEIDYASAIDVSQQIQNRKLQVVGWYHSHPKPDFSVNPSRVDIATQLNYQAHIFQEELFVGAIVAPYNEDLPDYNPEVELFRVHTFKDDDCPVRVPFTVSANAGVAESSLSSYYALIAPERRFPITSFQIVSQDLIATYSMFPLKVPLQAAWRDVKNIDKLRSALIYGVIAGDGAEANVFRAAILEQLTMAEAAWGANTCVDGATVEENGTVRMNGDATEANDGASEVNGGAATGAAVAAGTLSKTDALYDAEDDAKAENGAAAGTDFIYALEGRDEELKSKRIRRE